MCPELAAFMFVLLPGTMGLLPVSIAPKLHDTLKEITRSSPSTDEERDPLGVEEHLVHSAGVGPHGSGGATKARGSDPAPMQSHLPGG